MWNETGDDTERRIRRISAYTTDLRPGQAGPITVEQLQLDAVQQLQCVRPGRSWSCSCAAGPWTLTLPPRVRLPGQCGAATLKAECTALCCMQSSRARKHGSRQSKSATPPRAVRRPRGRSICAAGATALPASRRGPPADTRSCGAGRGLREAAGKLRAPAPQAWRLQLASARRRRRSSGSSSSSSSEKTISSSLSSSASCCSAARTLAILASSFSCSSARSSVIRASVRSHLAAPATMSS
mmetsp:Transcript_4086/g.11626  ORF Transcript_4086/g.11626 Transcript_4086/m.11626 type:complete len:241 (-) Transcript_4086:918-1640(-)